jgi:transposase
MELEEVPMRIVCAHDVHRRQITYAIVDVRSGEVSRGRVTPATRESVREWLARFDDVDDVHFALEGTTGWRFVVEEVVRAGHCAHLADPAETAVRRGRKRRAKTDRADCDLLLRLLAARELPESWIPPAQILELRTRVRLRKTLVDERTAWQQRLQAQLFHQGVPPGLRPRTRAGREALTKVELSPAGRELVALALRMIETIDRELAPLDRALSLYARHQPGCRALHSTCDPRIAAREPISSPLRPFIRSRSSGTTSSAPCSTNTKPRREDRICAPHGCGRCSLKCWT